MEYNELISLFVFLTGNIAFWNRPLLVLRIISESVGWFVFSNHNLYLPDSFVTVSLKVLGKMCWISDSGNVAQLDENTLSTDRCTKGFTQHVVMKHPRKLWYITFVTFLCFPLTYVVLAFIVNFVQISKCYCVALKIEGNYRGNWATEVNPGQRVGNQQYYILRLTLKQILNTLKIVK
jgi:hypothetical protein